MCIINNKTKFLQKCSLFFFIAANFIYWWLMLIFFIIKPQQISKWLIMDIYQYTHNICNKYIIRHMLRTSLYKNFNVKWSTWIISLSLSVLLFPRWRGRSPGGDRIRWGHTGRETRPTWSWDRRLGWTR